MHHSSGAALPGQLARGSAPNSPAAAGEEGGAQLSMHHSSGDALPGQLAPAPSTHTPSSCRDVQSRARCQLSRQGSARAVVVATSSTLASLALPQARPLPHSVRPCGFRTSACCNPSGHAHTQEKVWRPHLCLLQQRPHVQPPPKRQLRKRRTLVVALINVTARAAFPGKPCAKADAAAAAGRATATAPFARPHRRNATAVVVVAAECAAAASATERAATAVAAAGECFCDAPGAKAGDAKCPHARATAADACALQLLLHHGGSARSEAASTRACGARAHGGGPRRRAS
eukprot:364428-Chlamydomonas_euryale.AAC.1